MLLEIQYDPDTVVRVGVGRMMLRLEWYGEQWPTLVSIDEKGKHWRERERYRLTLSRHGACKLSKTLPD